jgi:protein ImuB
MPSRRRYLVLHLPRWATESLRRAEPALRELTSPFALYEKQKGAMRLVELDALATNAGLHATQSLSDARALCPSLVVREIDRPWLEAVFARFADWHSWASPLVAVLTDAGAYGDLVLDITGVSHLFGGEAALLREVVGRLEPLGFTPAAAIADTIGAAWAFAHCTPGRIVVSDLHQALARLPIAALRLDEAQVEGLAVLGLRTIGDLYGRDRKALKARFAQALLRLDAALGQLEEKFTPRLPPVEHFAERRFAEPIGLIDDVLMTAHDLAVRLSFDLEAQGLGAQQFHLFLYRTDHQLITLSVKASRATREAGHISRLFAHRAERLGSEYDAGFGIDMIRLAADTLSRLDAAQTGAFETRDGTSELAALYDRMASRLGPDAITRIVFADTHIPERASRLEPVLAKAPETAPPQDLPPRPLKLLPHPEPVEVAMAEVPDGPPRGMIWRRVRYRIVKARGPERIAPEWWRAAEPPSTSRRLDMSKAETTREGDLTGRTPGAALATAKAASEPPPPPPVFDASATTRDYFVLEDEGGRRFWVFREGLYGSTEKPRWFLHGIFA